MLDIALFRAGSFETKQLEKALEAARAAGDGVEAAQATLDASRAREEANIESVRASQRKRFSVTSKVKALAAAQAAGDAETIAAAMVALDAARTRQQAEVDKVDAIRAADVLWRETLQLMEKARAEFGKCNKAVGACKKAKDEPGAAAAQAGAQAAKAKVAELDAREKEVKAGLDGALRAMGNVCPASVPDNDDEDDAALGDPASGECNVHAVHGDVGHHKRWNHIDVMRMLDMMDVERGGKVAGSRGYFLKGDGVLLNQAIINLALAHLSAEGYTPLQTPFFMQHDAMAACAQLSDFHEALYKVVERDEQKGDEVKYLIATSEQPIACFHRGEKLERAAFPLRYAGYSTCFRKEAGKHGRDTLGVFRTHQFEKVEQFVYCSPHGDASWKEMEAMLERSASFYRLLEVPYRVVNIVSGELNDAAAKKFDLEAWFPGSRAFRELVSCSNCTDYQARRLDVRFGVEKGAPHCHMLNSTLAACERTMCCLVENYQTDAGIALPVPLRPFLGGRDFIPFKYAIDAKNNLIPRAAGKDLAA